ncbi:MAG: hypothetical protein JSU96_06200 [Acidobacteriota bacterium]|nr:MAG: hypothetical protein JSU96_06200 [Acidobacteriota bacterium]
MRSLRLLSPLSLLSILVIAFPGTFLWAQFGDNEQFFPQVAVGGTISTFVSVHNTGQVAATIDLDFFGSDGILKAQGSVTVPGGGTETVEIEIAGTDVVVGWARLSSPASTFDSAELFQIHSAGGDLLTQVGVLPSSPLSHFKLFVRKTGGFRTALAIANPDSVDVRNVTVQLFDSTGNQVGRRDFQVDPRHHLARFFDEEPFFTSLGEFEGLAEVTADGEVLAVSLAQEGIPLATIPVLAPASVLDPGVVQTEHIADGAVTAAKIANGAVTSEQLADQVRFGGSGDRGSVRILSEGSVSAVEMTYVDGTGVLDYEDGSTPGPGGYFQLADGQGHPALRFFALDVNKDGVSAGLFEGLNGSGNVLFRLRESTASEGSGVFELRGKTGEETFRVSQNTGGAGMIRTLDGQSNTLSWLTSINTPSGIAGYLSLSDSSGANLFVASVNTGGDALLKLQGADGKLRLAGTTYREGTVGYFGLFDSSENEIARLTGGTNTLAGERVGSLHLFRSGGSTMLAAGNTPTGDGVFTLHDAAGNSMIYMEASQTGGGYFTNLNSLGNQLVSISSNNHAVSPAGIFRIYNAYGDPTAGMNGADGVVFGQTKSFIVPDPDIEGRMIRYTSVEGPEAAIYVRGKGRLESGRAYVDFPDHFAAMAVSESITVSLTPRSIHSLGLAVVQTDSEGFTVRELAGGVGSYEFDYLVHAVRVGYEDYEVYLERDDGLAHALEADARPLEHRTSEGPLSKGQLFKTESGKPDK